MIADRHNSFNEGMCRDHEMQLLPYYLDNLFNKFKRDKWDFYIEQGVYAVDETTRHMGKFLHEAKKPLTVHEIDKYAKRYQQNLRDPPDIMELTYNYFRSQGCFFTDRTICNHTYKNTRFHFIDTRQAQFGKSCELPTLEKYAGIGYEARTLYRGLYDVVVKMRSEWHLQGRVALKNY